ncbi:MAG: hypothetical protein COV29_02490 [Candidatus Yanofskybacteria bacterium CG10_big_fil_rev_8_21_14_0_10_36_16]|uniref:Uncharacterized protein n=1 Tax=Candidatus Yanofskybacteria bacterium CG10_big_fil_rev_8_21_14_0_10_36_16 TaxID=1975096 RepID=A0A2J0QAK2_9BACT|nr:MAG: hypothetical protein COV29_02490 [Candidatus Yanofskybacteria bacterium CG10_big_fil_rev_8_21_14_0_10_36_16]
MYEVQKESGNYEPSFRESMLEDIELEKIREIAPTLFVLAKKIIQSGKTYDFILSDDASGRLVSLFIKRLIDRFQMGKGLSKTDIRFVSGGRHGNTETFCKIKELVKKIAPTHVLLVTECIDTGRSILILSNILRELNLDFDIATVSGSEDSMSNISSLLEQTSKRLYFGSEGWAGSTFQGYSGSGVIKYGDSLFPRKIITRQHMPNYRRKAQSCVNRARKDIALLAERIWKELA